LSWNKPATIQVATLDDLAGWLALAREVEPLFGPMVGDPSFHAFLRRVFREQRAFCIREDDGPPGSPLCGGIAISKSKNEIGWFAVAERHRGKGFGKALLRHALEHLDRQQEIRVQTFDETISDGRPARRLYQQFGFRDHHPIEPTSNGIPRVVMVRDRENVQKPGFVADC
jgi:GNAT superfamily N-acetyltransferase